MTPKEYTQSKEYLPEFMQDFHDQKNLFKAIHELYKNDENLKKLPNGWVDNHIFVVDFFLWFMGQHGYKLQQVRKKGIQFHSLCKTIEEMNGRRNNGLLEILKANKQQSNEQSK